MQKIVNCVGNETIIYATTFEYEAYEQVKRLANFAPYQNQKIRLMPDAHHGKGCTVGTTMTVSDKITPNLVGVDLNCGVSVTKLKDKSIDLEKLDETIRKFVPSGNSVFNEPIVKFSFDNLLCYKYVDLPRAIRSIGTLGGGKN